MCTFHTFEKNAFKDLQPPENQVYYINVLVLILIIVYACIDSSESLKQFSL